MLSTSRRERRVAVRKVRRSLTEISPLNSHPQMQSPLFSVLPPEIRNQIFELALSEHEDSTRPYDPTDNYYRPGHCFPKVINTDLLRTCRRVYYETNTIPMSSATHCFWLGTISCSRDPSRTPLRFESLTRKQQTDLNHVHVFMAYYCREFSTFMSPQQFRPKHLTITISWGNNWSDTRYGNDDIQQLFSASWGSPDLTKFPNELEDVKVEFEVTKEWKGKLDELVKRVMLWRFELRDGTNMVADESTTVKSWTRQRGWRRTKPPSSYEIHVVTVTWRRSASAENKD
ncbi:hypothetical protein W97_04683 [Coniosporium apollinis CBS 100218]|uniref:F-box domain-containing protein n=1 Tax=Coniosporium apollinis (strain CBS 100218) TaxID=1168221 RepID=R7YU71_CONA1|nr:uncharacterized protein W97_04683 [Coniosporium apollinis CBS 100218]EON65445.1 hypothetical protein W97_04683 [Coniosporium apollinis CBS 100218]